MGRLRFLTFVLFLVALPHMAEAQGQGRPKNPQASSTRDSVPASSTISTSQFRQFGVWLVDVPMLDAAYAVHDRVQLGMSVPFYRSGYGGTTLRGVDDMYFSGKIVLIDPALKDARFGVAVIPVLEVLSPGFFDDRVHSALPVR